MHVQEIYDVSIFYKVSFEARCQRRNKNTPRPHELYLYLSNFLGLSKFCTDPMQTPDEDEPDVTVPLHNQTLL